MLHLSTMEPPAGTSRISDRRQRPRNQDRVRASGPIEGWLEINIHSRMGVR